MLSIVPSRAIATGAVAAVLVGSAAYATGTVTVTTEVNDKGKVVGGTITCPQGFWGEAFAADIRTLLDGMSDKQDKKLRNKIGKFEEETAATTQSTKATADLGYEYDTVKSASAGSVTTAGADLCSYVAAHL